MPNPFEPIKSSPLAAPPSKPAPEFLPPDAFSRKQWPTWSDIEPGIHDLIANTSSNNNTNTTTNTTTTTTTQSNPSQQPHQLPPQQLTHRRQTISVTDARKRRLSKPAEAPQQQQQQQNDEHAHARWAVVGAGCPVGEVVEALRGKGEVEGVVRRLVEWRRVNQGVERKEKEGVGNEGKV